MDRAVALASVIVSKVLLVNALVSFFAQRIWRLAASLADAIEWLFGREKDP
jgi:hypothetical protein